MTVYSKKSSQHTTEKYLQKTKTTRVSGFCFVLRRDYFRFFAAFFAVFFAAFFTVFFAAFFATFFAAFFATGICEKK